MPSRDDSPLHAMMASSSSLSVQSLRARVPFVSQSALTSILEVVAKEGVPEQRKRKHIYDSTRQMLERMCLYGPLVMSAVAYTLSDQAVEITFVNFLSLLAGTYAMADSWADYFDKVHGEFPSSYANPWGLICYAVEVHPGNQLAGTARKVWRLYMSFVQFGRHLSKSELWWTVMVKRSEDVSKLQASIGQLFRIILENIFGGNALGHPSNGLLLKRGDKNTRLFFKFQMWLRN